MGALSFVQATDASGDNFAKATGTTVQLPSNVTPGNLLVVAVVARPNDLAGDAPTVSVADDVGSETFTQVGAQEKTTNHTAAMFYRTISSGETTCRVQVTATYTSTANTAMSINVYEYAPAAGEDAVLVDSSGAFDTDNLATEITCSPALTTIDDDLVLAVASIRTGAVGAAPDSPLAPRLGSGSVPGYFGWGDGELFASGQTSVSPRFTSDPPGGDAQWAAVAGQFRSEPPMVPWSLTATANGETQVDLSWSAQPTIGAYDIERNGVVVVTDHASTTYSDTGLDPGTEYTYRVRGVR